MQASNMFLGKWTVLHNTTDYLSKGGFKLMVLTYCKLKQQDSDIPYLQMLHALPQISRYISIDPQSYFEYVTTTEGIFYYKAYDKDQMVAFVHLELADEKLYISILTIPEYQKQGYANQVLEDIQSKKLIVGFTTVLASIDMNNIPSIRLFEKSGFVCCDKENGLLDYVWTV